MKKILLSLAVITLGMVYLTSCYNNKHDIISLPKVSFSNEVVHIVTSGPCGCHNALGRARNNAWVQFTDTLTGKPKYDLIYSYKNTLRQWANDSIAHPGGGDVVLTNTDKKIIQLWMQQGSPIDYGQSNISGPITYNNHIVPMLLQTVCNACHGRGAPALTYTTLTTSTNISILTKMANSGGTIGHPKGTVDLTPTLSKVILEWITQGTKQ